MRRSGGVLPHRCGVLVGWTPRVRRNEYATDEREEAIRAFEQVEAAIDHFPGAETVLVWVASVESLRDAYPSYVADTRTFVAELEKAIA